MKYIIKILNKFKIKYKIIGEKIYLENTILNLTYKNLIGVLDVSIIENLEKLYCYNNNLTDIICNDNLYHLNCSYNKITKIVCNEHLKYVYCYNNHLTEIKCNDNLKELYCSNNILNKINCNDNLQILYCFSNPILNLNRNNIYQLSSDIYIYDNKFYHDNIEIKNIKVKNNKKIMRVDNKQFLIVDDYPYNISDIPHFKENKNIFMERKR